MNNENSSDQALFISHSAIDRPYALALQTAIHKLVGSEWGIEVRFSSSAETGPQGGDRWRHWIDRQVVEARTALIVVTPESMGKPWLLWEAGACRGAALAQRTSNTAAVTNGPLGSRLLVSIAYGIAENECPDPLRGDQIVPGLDGDRMTQLLGQVLRHHRVPEEQLFKAGQRMQDAMHNYLDAVQRALLSAPSLVTEANVQDWLARLEELVRKDRMSELGGFERWLKLAFGREGETANVPIDVRLHRRLGELYLRRRDFERAVAQLDLARRAAPRDIYILRPLGESHMKRYLATEPAPGTGDSLRSQISGVLEAIVELDSDAFVSNPDAAALYGKYHRRALNDSEAAIGIFKAALERNPDSYYLADVLGQTQLEVGFKDHARATYDRAIDILDRLNESNIWTHATYATAFLVLGDQDNVRKSLSALAELKPPPSVVDSVCSGLRGIAGSLDMESSEVDELLSSLSSRSYREDAEAGRT